MVEGFDREKLVKIKSSKVWTGLYIMIIGVGSAYGHVSGESEWLPFMTLPWIGVVVTTVSFLFLFFQ